MYKLVAFAMNMIIVLNNLGDMPKEDQLTSVQLLVVLCIIGLLGALIDEVHAVKES